MTGVLASFKEDQPKADSILDVCDASIAIKYVNLLRGSDTSCLPNMCRHLVRYLPNVQARKIPLKLTNGVSKVTRHFFASSNDHTNRRLQSTNTIINRVIMFAINTSSSK